jgi:hypothetical protein
MYSNKELFWMFLCLYIINLGINPENEDDRNIVVKQCYPFKTRGVQSCESTRHQAMQEISRVINTDGTVIKTMPDGVVQVTSCFTKIVFTEKYVVLHMVLYGCIIAVGFVW